MFKRRKSGPIVTDTAPENFSVRWHAIANPATSSLDIMSSPDPLNEEDSYFAPPSSQRSTRSRLSPVRMRSDSPRKQQYELEYGDYRSRSKLLVTLEAQDDAPPSATARKLYSASPFAHRALSATTMRVPLKQSVEEESGPGGDATPRKRGRPRKNNGTPFPSAAKKRKAATPLRQGAKRPNAAAEPDPLSGAESQPTPVSAAKSSQRHSLKSLIQPSSDLGVGVEPSSDMVSIPTPTPKRRGRPPKNKSAEPSSVAKESAKTTRRRRQALLPEDLEAIHEAIPEEPDLAHGEDTNQTGLPSLAVEPEHQERSSPQGPESDIWMNTMANQETPRPRLPTLKPPSGAQAKIHISIPSSATSEADSETSGPEGYAADAPSISDAGSIMDAPTYQGPRNDTIAQEDFSMIFVDSIHSYQEFKSSAAGKAPTNLSDLDEEEERIVNTTLESLRQSRGSAKGEDSNVDLLQDREHPREGRTDHAEDNTANMEMDRVEGEPEEREAFSVQQDSMAIDADNDGDTMHTEVMAEPEQSGSKDMAEEIAEDELSPNEDIPIPTLTELPVPPIEEPGLSSSPATTYQEQAEDPAPLMSSAVQASHRGFSPRWLRTPRGSNVSPLRRRALASTAKQSRPAPLAHGVRDEDTRMDSSPSRRTNNDSNLYEDSFSEIPPAILEAATPGPPKMLPEVEMELDSEDGAGEGIGEGDEDMELPPQRSDPRHVEQAEHDPSEAERSSKVEPFRTRYTQDAPAQDTVVADAVGRSANIEEARSPQETEPKDQRELEMREDAPTSGPVSPDQSHMQNQTQPRAPSVVSSAHTESGRLPTPDDTPDDAQPELPQKAPGSLLADQAAARSKPDAQLPDELAESPQALEYLQPPQTEASLERDSRVPEITPLHQLSSPAQEPQSAGSQSTQDKAPRPALSAIVRAGKVLQHVTSDPPSPEDRQPQLRSPFRSSASKESWSGSRDAASGRRLSSSPTRRSTSGHRRTISMERLGEDPFAAGSRSTGQGSFMQALNRSMSEHANRTPGNAEGSTASSMRITPPDDEMSWVAEAGPIDPSLRGDVSLQEVAQLRNHPSRSEEPSQASAQGGPLPGDDETDIWEFEASRGEADEPVPHQKLFESRTAAPIHQKVAVPSPRAKRRSFAPRASASKPEASSAKATKAASAAAEEDEEEYSLLDKEKRAAEAAQAPPTASKPRFDLSAFFSSPASIPGMIADKLFPTKGQAANVTKKTAAVPTSSMFPSAPQQQPSRPSSEMEAMTSSPVRVQSRQPLPPRVDQMSTSPGTPEKVERPIPARRLEPVPQQRRASTSRGPIPTAPSTIPTPPRMQLSHEDIARWQQEASQATSSSESNGSPRRFLRPLPPRNASPSKSNIRSPLKPRTPGRVVEFTSSVLEPADQAQKDQEQQQHHHHLMQQRPLAIAEPDRTPSSQPAQSPHVVNEQENRRLTSVRSSRFAQSKVHPSELSPTEWSKRHWTLLDDLLKARRSSPFPLAAPRQSGKLLGKVFKVKGENILIERWHLDVVDAFCAEVGGWDAQTVCKRLFCLIVNEERSVQKQRARQLQKQREREHDAIMFH
ncbi:uncharacterized protein F5Z01DRAFT_391065 [Emericellopsis atlantica]|uniref:Uncharacterized protein n=1 Tax=Emericellopsis atlantica TaxID=2614577 RepID=A0A9P7ZSE4_9HYPO|nr:uncharacterized protein F5Z01DRAFT_391065 [Emericellopsis atlantica]KAG9257468.1 hypothetical protein F5Z01DRAFT_391065 [Emericellopsis atlantica]